MLDWQIKKFDEFTLDELHDLIALRIEVFVVEQDCVYQELDGKDKLCTHILVKKDDKIIATTRIVPPGLSYDDVSFGRVVIDKAERGNGIGHDLVVHTIKAIQDEFGTVPVRISAQEYLINYYGKHGFTQVSEMYLEDGIPHIEMLYTP